MFKIFQTNQLKPYSETIEKILKLNKHFMTLKYHSQIFQKILKYFYFQNSTSFLIYSHKKYIKIM